MNINQSVNQLFEKVKEGLDAILSQGRTRSRLFDKRRFTLSVDGPQEGLGFEKRGRFDQDVSNITSSRSVRRVGSFRHSEVSPTCNITPSVKTTMSCILTNRSLLDSYSYIEIKYYSCISIRAELLYYQFILSTPCPCN